MNQSVSAAPLCGLPILVMDIADDASARRDLRRLLDAWGAHATDAADADEAARLVQKSHSRGEPFVATLISGAGPDAFETAALLRRQRLRVGAICLLLPAGTEIHAQLAARCLRLGVSAYLSKPVREADLQALLEAVREGIAATALPEELESSDNPWPGAEQRLRFLLVEDNPVNLIEAAAQIQRVGHEVHRATSGEAALRALAQDGFRIDCVLMDLGLPGMSGIEVTRRIRAREESDGDRLPIIGLTGADGPTVAQADPMRAECLAAGMDDLLYKPLRLPQLFPALHRALRGHARRERTELESLVKARTAELSALNEQLRREMASREQVEIELRHSHKLEAVGQLAAGIAHEINTPIQFIGDSVYFLRDAFSDLRTLVTKDDALLAEVAQALPGSAALGAARAARGDIDLDFLSAQIPPAFDRTLEGIDRVAKIVRAMKEFAHPAQKEKAYADINKMIETTLIVARNEYKYVAEVTTDLGTLPAVPCIAGDLNQVFLNLIVNAAHAIADAGKDKDKGARGLIRVVTRATEDGGVRVSISDSGCGIPEAVRPRIFDPFFTTKEIGRGTGQGLTISRSIVVDRHGGSITYETEVGRGTTFHVRLPA